MERGAAPCTGNRDAGCLTHAHAQMQIDGPANHSAPSEATRLPDWPAGITGTAFAFPFGMALAPVY